MKSEEVLLLALLQASFNKEKLSTEIVTSLNDESLAKVLSLSARHSVTTIVADVLLSNGLLENSELKAVYEETLMVSVYQYHQQQMELERLCRLFEEKGIYHIPLKGSVLRKLYREPWLRTCCDVDILVKPQQLDEAVELLLACDYRLDTYYSHDVSFFTEGNMRVELHYDLIEEENHIGHVSEVLENVWEYAQPAEGYTYAYKLDKEMFYFYHIAHMVKHFIHGGCGIRSIIDGWLMHQSWEFDTEKADQLLKEGGILVFERKIKELITAWWNDGEMSDIVKIMEKYILAGGVYGSHKNVMAMESAENGTKWRNAMAKIFLKTSIMYSYYPVLKKKIWLLPFYHIKRWCKLIFKKEHRERSLIYLQENQLFPNEKTKEAMELLSQLELKEGKK